MKIVDGITNKTRWLLMLAVASAMFVHLLYVPGCTMDPETDHDVFVFAGKFLCDGGRMYVDFFDHKGPFLFLLNQLGWCLSQSYLGVWWLELGFFIVGLVLFWKGLLTRNEPGTALLVAFAIVILKMDPNFYNHAESWAVEFAAIAIGALLCRVNVFTCMVGGILGACVFMTKQTLIGPFLALFVVLCGDAIARKQYRFLFAYCISGLVGVAVFWIYMLTTGVFTAFLEDCFRFNMLYQNSNRVFVDGAGVQKWISSFVSVFSSVRHLLAIPTMAFIATCLFDSRLKRINKTLVLAWLVWFVWDVLLTARCGRFFPHHFITLKLCLLLSIWPVIKLVPCQAPARLALLLMLPFVLPEYMRIAPRLLTSIHGEYRLRDETVRVNEFVKAQQDYPDMPLLVWGNNVRAYMLTGRKNPFPYYYWGPMSVDGFLSEEQVANSMEFLINTDVMIVDGINPSSPQDTELFVKNVHSKDSLFKRRLREVVVEHYQLSYDGESGVKIYTRKKN